MKRIKIKTVFMIAVLSITPFFYTSCATILGCGGKDKSERSSDIRWGYFIADIFLTGAIGLVIDFATGAIYESKSGKYSELNKKMLQALNKGMPAYIIKKDGIYNVKLLKDGKLEMVKTSESQLPPKVVESLHLAIAH